MNSDIIKCCKNCGKEFLGNGLFCSTHCAHGYNPVINKICPHCKKEFTIKKKEFAAHVKYCPENPNKKKIDEKLLDVGFNNADKRFGQIKKFKVNCHFCKKEFFVEEREKSFPKKERYYCSDKCRKKYACSFIDEEVRKKMTNTLIQYRSKKALEKHKNTDHFKILKICPECGKEFKKTTKYCSRQCAIKAVTFKKQQHLDKSKLEDYRKLCNFHFSLRDYPDEFDFSLIEKYGWYKAKNHGNNLNGISRDHIYSIREGFKNNVDPKILAHPANCQLMRHCDNVSKYSKCQITLEQLKIKIDAWDKKYNKV